MFEHLGYNGPLCEWVEVNSKKDDKGTETHFWGKYYFKIGERLYYFDLRCVHNGNPSHAFCRLFTHLSTGELFYVDLQDVLPELGNQMLTTRSFREVCECFAQTDICILEEKVSKMEQGRKLLSDEEWESLKISSFCGKEEYWPWKMIDACGREFRKARFSLISHPCFFCGTPIIKAKFSTSPESWENLAGCEGWIYFCPTCQEQFKQEITAMN